MKTTFVAKGKSIQELKISGSAQISRTITETGSAMVLTKKH